MMVGRDFEKLPEVGGLWTSESAKSVELFMRKTWMEQEDSIKNIISDLVALISKHL
jgi:hypothetical protein